MPFVKRATPTSELQPCSLMFQAEASAETSGVAVGRGSRGRDPATDRPAPIRASQPSPDPQPRADGNVPSTDRLAAAERRPGVIRHRGLCAGHARLRRPERPPYRPGRPHRGCAGRECRRGRPPAAPVLPQARLTTSDGMHRARRPTGTRDGPCVVWVTAPGALQAAVPQLRLSAGRLEGLVGWLSV